MTVIELAKLIYNEMHTNKLWALKGFVKKEELEDRDKDTRTRYYELAETILKQIKL